jgi:carboxymethylenebutenolidase
VGVTKAVQDLMVAVERARDAFARAVFVDADPAAARALATADATVEILPAGSGASGGEALERWLASDVVPALPPDLAFRRVSRTGDRWQVADEETLSFTHDRELPWLLPGVAPTGRGVEVLVMTVVSVHRGKVRRVRMLTDQHGLLGRLGVHR